jgi:hypothetical protein
MAKWDAFEPGPADFDWLFPDSQQLNICIRNGSPSGNRLDVDLDSPQARAAADLLLPPTGMVFGRPSSPRSHRIYRVDQDFPKAQEKFTDLDGADLLELRGSGGITIYPPSCHKDSGEAIAWDKCDEPGQVGLTDLHRAVSELAAAAILARHWPAKGSLHDARLCLAGGLLRAGWDRERTVTFLEAVALAAENTPRGDCRGAVESTAKRLEDPEEAKQVKGWPSLAELLGDKVVTRARNWLGLTQEKQTIEIPVFQEPAWPDPPAEEAFHGLAGRIVRMIEPSSEADPVALLVQTLVAFGSIIGRGAHFPVEGDKHHGNEFIVLVGKTSKGRKGTSFNRINRLMTEVEEAWATSRIQTGLSSGEGLIWAVRDPISKREKIKDKGEVRYEDVEVDPGESDKRLLVYEPEFANVLKQTERQGNTLSAILRQAWDGMNLRTMTKNSPARSTGAHISLIGHITADELRRYLTLTESANGFGNRHTWFCIQRSKQLPEGGPLDPAEWAATREDLVRSLEFAKTVGEIRRDADAREIWAQVYGELSEGRPGLAGAILARTEAHVMRFAMLYALLDCSPVIRADHLLASLALMDYATRSVLYVFGEDLGDAVADDILRLLRGCPGGLTRNEIRNFFDRNQPAQRIGKALGLLLQHRLARSEQHKDTGGRPAERWYAVGRSK